jgi:HEAT repeat protein
VELLGGRDAGELRGWAREERNAMELLVGLTFHRDAQVRWRAVEALGLAAAVQAEGDREAVRDRLRRLLWSMNHESGNVMWLGPDAVGEILTAVPELADEFARVVASFIALEPFVHGVHRAVARIASVRPDPVAYLAPYLEHALSDRDPVIRAHAAVALAHIDPSRAGGIREQLARDDDELEVYDRAEGALVTTSVCRLVQSSIRR